MTIKSSTAREAGEPAPIFSLRQKLGQKAKREPKFRFYSLYGHILREDVLLYAFKKVKENRGTAGVDGVTVEDIESKIGVKNFVVQLQEELRKRRYRPQPVKRVYIPKADGRKRPLGIPTVRDRTVQMAVLLVLEPIFEADFLDCSYGFRPNRSAHDALAEIKGSLKAGFHSVYDADLKGYFDSIPHTKLMACVRMRVADRQVLKLIRMWLEVPVVEMLKEKGGKPRWSRPLQGTPQGGVCSPLLANLYLHWFDVAFHRPNGPAHWANARLVRYADDFVVLARHQGKELHHFIQDKLENWMSLKLNLEKTRTITLSPCSGSFDFLGYTFRLYESRFYKGYVCQHLAPSAKALKRGFARIRELTGSERRHQPIDHTIGQINTFLCGWGRYFSLGSPSKAYQKINFYTGERVLNNLRRRSQRGFNIPRGMNTNEYLKQLGLIRLTKEMFRKRACQ